MVRFHFIRLSTAVIAVLLLHYLADSVSAQTKIWGESGEAWVATGILPDFSYAGYQRGEQPIPDRKATVSVTKYGAKPNTDATEAIQKAIDENPGQCIEIPAGKFLLSKPIQILNSGTVLQGAGVRKTTLYFTRSLNEINPAPAKTGGGLTTTQWSWSGGLIVMGNYELVSAERFPVTGESKRGDDTIEVDSLRGIVVGDDVRLEMHDDEAGTLTNYLYRGTPGDDSLIKGHVLIRHVARVVSIDGNQVKLDRPLRTDILPGWKPTIQKFVSKYENCGLEELTIEFPERPYQGHFTEAGYNGIDLRGTNNWVRNIEIHNADSGIFVHGQFNTIDRVTIRSKRKSDKKGNTGHHGLSAMGQDCLITNFSIRTKFIHDITLGQGSVGNVLSEGRGIDLCFDFHRYAPYENLLTKIDLGRGTRPWDSGGTRGKGRYSAAGTTFWNIDSDLRIGPPKEEFGPRDIIFVGLNARDAGNGDPVILPGGWYYEGRRPGKFEPANLHQAQVLRRLKKSSR